MRKSSLLEPHLPLSISPSSNTSNGYASHPSNSLSVRISHRLRRLKKKFFQRIPFFENRRVKFIIYICLAMVFIRILLLIASGVSSWMDDIPPLIIEKQDYSPVRYLGINPNASTRLPEGVTIYHITKEFGVASLGGLGQMVTGLAQAQSTNSSLRVNVIMPYYSFLSKVYRPQKYAQLAIKIRDKNGKWRNVKFLVYRLWWNLESKDIVPSDSEPNIVSVFMIGPASNMVPLNVAFKASNVARIYHTKSGLPPEWKDIYFCKAAAELIAFRNTMTDTSLFAQYEARGVDVVHIYGSTNAFIIEFIKHFHNGGKFGKQAPAIVYTMNDYLEEQLYSNDLSSIQKFIDFDVSKKRNLQYFHNDRMYMSSYAIDNAQMVTFISEYLATEIVEGPMDFHLRELILPNILNKAKLGQWIGITNGVDFVVHNPFNDTMLIESNANFPKNIYDFDPILLYAEPIEGATQDLVTASKQSAKAYLVREGLLDREDLNRPLILYVGKFQYKKGLQFFQMAAELLVEMDAKFIIMGQKSNYNTDKLKRLISNAPDNIILIDDVDFQKDWGVLYRAASDILFMPSLVENFGLNAAEGLLFGMPVVSTGVGGLKEFLVNKTKDVGDIKIDYNSYLFELVGVDDQIIDSSSDNMKMALLEAINDWKRLRIDTREREIFLRKLIKDAFKLSWDRPGGPVEQYLMVYRLAMLQVQDDLEEGLWIGYDDYDDYEDPLDLFDDL